MSGTECTNRSRYVAGSLEGPLILSEQSFAFRRAMFVQLLSFTSCASPVLVCSGNSTERTGSRTRGTLQKGDDGHRTVIQKVL